MSFRFAIAFLTLVCATFARAESEVAPSPQERISCGEAYCIALETALKTMPDGLFPRFNTILQASRKPGRILVTFSSQWQSARKTFNPRGHVFAAVELDDSSGKVLSCTENHPDARYWLDERHPGKVVDWYSPPEMPEPLSDRDACKIVSRKFNELPIPSDRIGASVVRTNGLAIVTVVFEAIEGFRSRSEHVFTVDEKTRTILPDPELSDALDPGGPLSEKKALCIVSERLHGMWFGEKGHVATSVTNLPGRTRVVLSYRESGNQQSALREGTPLAVVEIDETTRKTIPSKGTLSDDKTIEIAKRYMSGRTPSPGCSFLVDHVGGITVVGFPRLIGLWGQRCDASQGDFPMEFDPTLWIHDATGEIIAGIEEPD